VTVVVNQFVTIANQTVKDVMMYLMVVVLDVPINALNVKKYIMVDV
jgi:hypothetical protein